MGNEQFYDFQFPLCLLAYGSDNVERLIHIVSRCLVCVGEEVYEKFSEEELTSYIEALPKKPAYLDKTLHAHRKIIAASRVLNVNVGDIHSTSAHCNATNRFIYEIESVHGRFPLVRINRELVWEVINGTGIDYRGFAILCAIRSVIGAKTGPVRITRETIQCRMLGYKTEECMKAEFEKRTDGLKILTRRQIGYTLDELHLRKCFQRARANKRETYYQTHCTSDDELRKLIKEIKLKRFKTAEKRINSDADFINGLKASRNNIKLLSGQVKPQDENEPIPM